MNNSFEKIYTNFKIDWNIDDLLQKFTDEIIDPINAIQKKRNYAYGKPDGSPHWQFFDDANISFGRNIIKNFPNEMQHLLDKLQEVQYELKNITQPSDFLQLFLTHKLDVSRINLIKVNAHAFVNPHYDFTKTTSRDIALNIGLKNSSSHITCIRNDNNIKSFWVEGEYKTFTMNDGDIYLLKTKNAHALNPNQLVQSTEPRYIITYTLVGFGHILNEKNTIN